MKRIFLFLATNLAVMLVLSFTASLLGVNRFLTANGLNLGTLLAFAALMGFGGSFISLLMSKSIAKWSTGAQVITHPCTSTELWLVQTVQKLATRAGLPMPEVAIYDGEPNAFATGASKKNSLVAVSTGLLQSMSHDEVEAVLAHEVAHLREMNHSPRFWAHVRSIVPELDAPQDWLKQHGRELQRYAATKG